MAKIPHSYGTHPVYAELRGLMRQGISEQTCSLCGCLREVDTIQEEADKEPAHPDRTAVEARVLNRRLCALIDSVPMEPAQTLARRTRRVLFGLDREITGKLDDRRGAILARQLEHASESTLKRREFLLIAALMAGLGIRVATPSLSEAKQPDAPATIDLSGAWVALWQTTVHMTENHNYEDVFIEQTGSTLDVFNEAISPDNPEGGYLWRGQLVLHEDRTIVGAYAAAQRGVGSRGTLFYVLNRSGKFMEGRWVGSNIDLELNTGVCVLARDRAIATTRFRKLLDAQAIIYTRS